MGQSFIGCCSNTSNITCTKHQCDSRIARKIILYRTSSGGICVVCLSPRLRSHNEHVYWLPQSSYCSNTLMLFSQMFYVALAAGWMSNAIVFRRLSVNWAVSFLPITCSRLLTCPLLLFTYWMRAKLLNRPIKNATLPFKIIRVSTGTEFASSATSAQKTVHRCWLSAVVFFNDSHCFNFEPTPTVQTNAHSRAVGKINLTGCARTSLHGAVTAGWIKLKMMVSKSARSSHGDSPQKRDMFTMRQWKMKKVTK